MSRAAALLLALAALVAAVGCGGDDDQRGDPGTFAAELLRTLDRGEAATAWEQLHPQHRDKVPRATYVRCERGDEIAGEVTTIDVLDVFEEPATVPGRDEPEPSTAVTLRYTLQLPDGAAPQTHDLEVHLFDVDDRWAWVIGPSDYAAYAAGRCPGPE